jgi:hypothetical protein
MADHDGSTDFESRHHYPPQPPSLLRSPSNSRHSLTFLFGGCAEWPGGLELFNGGALRRWRRMLRCTLNPAACSLIHSFLTDLDALLPRSLFLPRYAFPPFYLGGYYGVPSSHVLRALAVDQFYCAGGAAAGCLQISVPASGLPAPLLASATGSVAAGYVTVDRYDYVAATLQTDYGRRWFEWGMAAVSSSRGAAVAKGFLGTTSSQPQCDLPPPAHRSGCV